ncbi:MAG: GNAT family N-acetyltransferase [Hyphomicrobiaceae bacterium]
MVLRLDTRPPALTGLSFAPAGRGRLQEVRALQIAAFRLISRHVYDDVEAAAYERYIASPEHADRQMLHQVETALVGDQIVGTAGWIEATNEARSARLTDLFVTPLFMRMGIGRVLAARAERRALDAGFGLMTARSASPVTGFLSRAGYTESGRGTFSPSPGTDLPVIFMRKSLAHAAAA